MWEVRARGAAIPFEFDGSSGTGPAPTTAFSVGVDSRGAGRVNIYQGFGAALVTTATTGTRADGAGKQSRRRRAYLGAPTEREEQEATAKVPAAEQKAAAVVQVARDLQERLREAVSIQAPRVPVPMTTDDAAPILQEAMHARQVAEHALALVQAALDDMEAIQAASMLLN